MMILLPANLFSILVISSFLVIICVLFFINQNNNKNAARVNRFQEVQIRLLSSIARKQGVSDQDINLILKRKRRKEAKDDSSMHNELNT